MLCSRHIKIFSTHLFLRCVYHWIVLQLLTDVNQQAGYHVIPLCISISNSPIVKETKKKKKMVGCCFAEQAGGKLEVKYHVGHTHMHAKLRLDFTMFCLILSN